MRVTDDVLMKQVERLRYEVYCLETGMLDPERYPAGRERDQYDAFSVQLAAKHGDQVVGTVRLILDSPVGFPLDRFRSSLSRWVLDLPRQEIGEISRLLVAPRYRRLLDLCVCSWCWPRPEPEQPTSSLRRAYNKPCDVSLGLFRELHCVSRDANLRYWIAAMEPPLRRLLRRFGFVFEQAGDPIEYYGQVVPYIGDIEAMEQRVAEDQPEFFASLN